MKQINLFIKQKQTHRLRERTFGYQGEKDEGRDSQGVWDGHVHTAIFKMNNQQRPTIQTQNSAQCYVAGWMGGCLGENGYMYMYG